MSEVLYTNGIQHTPVPRGPLGVGSADVCTEGEQGIMARIFYPTQSKEDQPENWAHWHLGWEYSRGAANFVTNFNRVLSPCFTVVFQRLSREVRVPSSWCLPIHPEGVFPVVVLSHGMSAHRSFLSTIATDLASHGYVVIAIEHREGSAAACTHLQEGGAKKVSPFAGFLGDDQFSQRVEEIFSTVAYLEALNKGEAKNAFPEGEVPLDLSMFQDKLDLSRLVLLGHSYGGTSVMRALGDQRGRVLFRGGVALDPWMFPVRHNVEETASKLTLPLLCISTWGFNEGPNLKTLGNFAEAVPDQNIANYLTIRQTVHQHGNDSPWIARRFCWALFGGLNCPPAQTVRQLQSNLIINFFDTHTDRPTSPHRDVYEKFIADHSHLIVTGNNFRD
ncbi:platelet-activating factor acetylhydrolase-like [Oratosquilla oratoria]|uniref:platelet-activating factor acetylhydrolase-like n=1 Tax=Oratosquilla oratoria TaxID=337810 RepID=UPI003F76CE8A